MDGYPTRGDIDEMKKRGYDRTTVAAAEVRRERGAAARQLCEVIRQAFAGVRLGNGVGLTEARAIDDYADKSTRGANRAADEQHDWEAIPTEMLDHYHDTLSFFDAEGMRFHLPAFLVADLRGLDRFGLAFTLTHLSEYSRSQFVLFSGDQRRAVRAFLQHISDDPEYAFSRADILRALEEYWTEPG